MIIDRSKYREEDVKISITAMNIVGIIGVILMILVFDLLYNWIWNESFSRNLMDGYTLLYLLGGIILHELTHALISAHYAERGWKSIKFGVMWKYLAAYCHCTEPLTVKQYKQVAIAPSVWAFVVMIIAFALHQKEILTASMFLFIGGIGDFSIIYVLRKDRDDTLVQDYSHKIGAGRLIPKTEEELILENAITTEDNE